jgi:hypothetical protein
MNWALCTLLQTKMSNVHDNTVQKNHREADAMRD